MLPFVFERVTQAQLFSVSMLLGSKRSMRRQEQRRAVEKNPTPAATRKPAHRRYREPDISEFHA